MQAGFAIGNTVYERISKLERSAFARPNVPIPGLSGFLFDIPTEETLSLNSNITDHFVEANYAIHDHWAHMPERLTLSGKMGEMVIPRTFPSDITPPVEIPEKPNPMMVPIGSEDTIPWDDAWLKEEPRKYTSAYDKYKSAEGNHSRPGSKQFFAVEYLQQIWLGRVLMSVETPWGVYTNMALESVEAKQGAASNAESEITVTFKKIRIAEEAVTVKEDKEKGISGVLVSNEVRRTDRQTSKMMEEPQQKAGFLTSLQDLALRINPATNALYRGWKNIAAGKSPWSFNPFN